MKINTNVSLIFHILILFICILFSKRCIYYYFDVPILFLLLLVYLYDDMNRERDEDDFSSLYNFSLFLISSASLLCLLALR